MGISIILLFLLPFRLAVGPWKHYAQLSLVLVVHLVLKSALSDVKIGGGYSGAGVCMDSLVILWLST